MLALPADPWGHEQAPERLCLPGRSTCNGRHPALVQVGADRPQRLACKQAPSALAHDDRFRLAHGSPIGLVPIRPRPSARDLARLRQLLVLSPDAPALVVALLLRHGPEDTSEELAVVGRQVDVAAHRRQSRDPRLPADVEELLQLLGLPVQAVSVPDDDGVEIAVSQVVEHPPVPRPNAPVVRAHVVVDVALGDLPASASDEPLAVVHLPPHAQVVAIAVGGDPRVHGGSNH